MAVRVPNGTLVFIATALAAATDVSAASNAAECEMTSAGHGLKDGDYVVVQSGWGGINGRVFRVIGVAGDKFKLEKFDTSNLNRFPAGSGVGKVQKVNTWQQITQITELSTTGGEQQFTEFGFLEEDYDRQLPTTRSAGSLTFSVADDPSLPGYQALAKAADSAAEWPLRLNLKGGSVIVYNGYPSLNKTPTMTRNEIMVCSASFALSGEPNRY